MQVDYVTVDDFPAAELEKERAIELQKEDLQSKPEAIREKIVEGRVAKIAKERALLEQDFIKDTSKTVWGWGGGGMGGVEGRGGVLYKQYWLWGFVVFCGVLWGCGSIWGGFVGRGYEGGVVCTWLYSITCIALYSTPPPTPIHMRTLSFPKTPTQQHPSAPNIPLHPTSLCTQQHPSLHQVGDYIKETIAATGENIQVRRFTRFTLGEGIEKKEVDFAAEVAAQTGGLA